MHLKIKIRFPKKEWNKYARNNEVPVVKLENNKNYKISYNGVT